jgi:serine phosphatase RsbU (regulator of sigma subunit)
VLALRGEHWGYLLVDRLGSADFRRAEIELVAAFASQATVAIENARLYSSQQEETWISTALLQVAEAMVGRPTLDEALATVARLTPLLVGVERVVIFQWQPAAQRFAAAEVMGLGPAPTQALRAEVLAAEALGISPDDPNVTARPVALPPVLAQAFGTELGMVWPLRARGDLLGALVLEGLPDLGRRQTILDGIAHQLAMAMESARLARDAAAQQRLQHELDVARGIQASFIPNECPWAPGWELCASWQVAQQVGGDFYDFIPLRADPGQQRWGIVIADVAGKGVPAALYMAMSRTIVRSAAISRVSPAATLTRVNQLILNDTRSDLFVTMFYGVWEPATGRFAYANAGHNPPLSVTAAGAVRPLPGGGMVLGVMEDIQYAEHETHLQPGELLLLYTDGLTEAINGAEEQFGLDRVYAHLGEAQRGGDGAEAALARLSKAVQSYAGPAGMFDDVTMVALRRTGRPSDNPV